MSEDLLRQWADYKAIVELKARFGRYADVKDWAGYRSLFTDDCHFDFGGGYVVEGGQAGTDVIAGMLAGTVSVHRAYMPEIDFVSETEATGIWAVNDYIEWPHLSQSSGERAGQMGYGREYETYRKDAGIWRIARWRLRYDRLDPLPRQLLPETFHGESAALNDPQYVRSVVDPNGT